MSRGRPPLKSALVDALPGPEEDKRRLRLILATVSGELTVAQACEQLGVGETRFFDLRRQALESALAGIAPKEPGRPQQQESPEAARIRELQQQLEDLKFQLYTSKVKAELAEVMPHVLKDLKNSERTKPPRRVKKKGLRPRG
jgi:transposase-like protein